MTSEQAELLKNHTIAITEILYADPNQEIFQSISAIETVLRQEIQEHISPKNSQISEYLEQCYLLVSANNFSQRTKENLAVTIRIIRSSQQRLVYCQEFDELLENYAVNIAINDSDKARIRTPKGVKSICNDYKIVTVEKQLIGGYFKHNQASIDCFNSQLLAKAISYLGDGRDRIWILFRQICCTQQRLEIIASGAVKSAVNKISRRIKISGVQWTVKNFHRAIQHRCTFFNGQFSPCFTSSTA